MSCSTPPGTPCASGSRQYCCGLSRISRSQWYLGTDRVRVRVRVRVGVRVRVRGRVRVRVRDRDTG